MRLIKADNTQREKEPAVRRILFWIITALMAAAVVEFGCNYKAIRNQYAPQRLQISQNIEDGKLKLKAELADSVYVSKLHLQGVFPDETNYNVKITYVNAFGREESEKISDKVYPYYQDAWSPINKTISEIEIIFPKADQADIEGVWIQCDPSVNWYRVFFVVFLVFTAWMIFSGKKIFIQNPEYIFAVYSLGFGMLLIAAAGPKYMTWDEPAHYSSVHTLSYGEIVTWDKASWANWQSELPDVNTLEELKMMKTYANQQSEEVVSEEINGNSFLRRGQYIYLPMVLFYRLGRALGLSFSGRFMLGRMGNLFVCVLLGFLAVRLAKKRKLLIMAILMFPTVLFQECMYTYDGLIVAFSVLGCVLWRNETDRGNRRLNKGAAALTCVLFLMACMIKPVYLPLFLLFFAFPNGKIRINKRFVASVLGSVLLAGAILAVFLLPSIRAALGGDLTYGADIRGGDTGIVAQCLSMVRHPLASIVLFIREMLTMDNFRNLALAGMDDYLPTNLMFLNMANFGTIKDEWSLVLIPLLLLLFFVSPEKQCPSEKSGRVRGILLVSVTVSVLAIWGAMYVTFTPVGYSAINGVQARYFIPLMLPTGYLLWNDRIEIRIKETTYFKIVLGTILLLMGQCVYQLVILGRCI